MNKYDRKFKTLFGGVIIICIFEVLAIFEIRLPSAIAPFFFGSVILYYGRNLLLKGAKSLVKLKFSDISLLMLIAVISAFYLGEYVEATVVILVYLLGEKLEDIGVAESKSALEELIKKRPKTAQINEKGGRKAVEKINVGEFVYVKPGEMIPLDGEIAEGQTCIDESNITGEPLPKDKKANDYVYASTLNQQGFIKILVKKTHENTTFSKILRITFEASANKSETQKFIERFSKVYTPSVVVLALLLVVIPVGVLDESFNHWLSQAITILVIACPCALVISTPVAIYAGIGNATQKGVVIKGGKYLELIGRVKSVAFDKTRTLTYGQPLVTDVIPVDTTEQNLLSCLAGAEQFSEHPLAKAIVDATVRGGYEIHQAKNYETVVGKGAKAECAICKQHIRFGSPAFMQESRKFNSQIEGQISSLQQEGKTVVVVSFDDQIRGVIGISDKIRPESKEVIRSLKQMKVRTIMLTGDHKDSAQQIGKELGIDEIHAELLPEDKAEKVRNIEDEYRPISMVGDGVNDTPALATADVGIAMGATGSDSAIEIASISLLNDNPDRIPYLIRLGKKVNSRIKSNTIMAVGVKLVFLLLAVFGVSSLVSAIFADVGIMIIVILLSLQIKKSDIKG